MTCPTCEAEVEQGAYIMHSCQQCGTEFSVPDTGWDLKQTMEGFDNVWLGVHGVTPEERAFMWMGWSGTEYREYAYRI